MQLSCHLGQQPRSIGPTSFMPTLKRGRIVRPRPIVRLFILEEHLRSAEGSGMGTQNLELLERRKWLCRI
jgi:hypothetical protein